MAEITFGLIGPLDIRCCGQPIVVPAARQRSLLAALLVRANQPVAKHSLCEAIWTGRRSDRAETTLRSYVMRLRRVLGPALASRLSFRPPGYLLRLEQDDEFDLLQFQGCLKRGKSAARRADWDQSMREFHQGLALWRGEPLCDVPSDYLRLSVVPVLTELRAQAWEGLYAAALHQGRAAEFVIPLQRLTEEDPLSERFSTLFMSALAGCSRRIDALAEFRRLRRALVDEQGVEPSRVIRELHQRLLSDDAEPAAATPGRRQTATTAGAIPVPRQLPLGTATFTGRAHEVGELVSYLSRRPDAAGTATVAAVTGFPGIGKSELAIAVAHSVADHYPDGQLYADLRGSRADPIAPGKITARFLRALGVVPAAVASDAAERTSQYRSLLATRRVLIVLDDALDADQVRPLLAGSGSAGILVTARRCLPHLAQARRTVLAEMTDADARHLLRAILGPERVSREPAAVASIVAACAGVPLALCIVGARLAARPSWPIEHLARLLADERHRLDELAYDRASVRTRLEAAYQAVASAETCAQNRAQTTAIRAFRLLGLRQSAAITATEAAVLFDQSLAEATAALETLVDGCLLASPAPGSYRLHDLTRIFAIECAARAHSPG